MHKNLIFVNQYLETDSNRNGGGNLLIADLASSVGTGDMTWLTLRNMEEVMLKFCNMSLLQATDRFLTDKDYTLIHPFVKYVYNINWTLAKVSIYTMRELMGAQQFTELQGGFKKLLDIQLGNGHFNHNIVCISLT